jgi:hypothetical protein
LQSLKVEQRIPQGQETRHAGLAAPDISCDLCWRWFISGSLTHRIPEFGASPVGGIITATSGLRWPWHLRVITNCFTDMCWSDRRPQGTHRIADVKVSTAEMMVAGDIG